MGVMEAKLGAEIVRKFNEFTNSESFYANFQEKLILTKDDTPSIITNNLYISYFATSSVSLLSLLDRKGILIENFDEYLHNASDKIPFLIFRQNNTDIFVILPEVFISALQFYYGMYEYYSLEFVDIMHERERLLIIKLDDFLSYVETPDRLQQFLSDSYLQET